MWWWLKTIIWIFCNVFLFRLKYKNNPIKTHCFIEFSNGKQRLTERKEGRMQCNLTVIKIHANVCYTFHTHFVNTILCDSINYKLGRIFCFVRFVYILFIVLLLVAYRWREIVFNAFKLTLIDSCQFKSYRNTNSRIWGSVTWQALDQTRAWRRFICTLPNTCVKPN